MKYVKAVLLSAILLMSVYGFNTITHVALTKTVSADVRKPIADAYHPTRDIPPIPVYTLEQGRELSKAGFLVYYRPL